MISFNAGAFFNVIKQSTNTVIVDVASLSVHPMAERECSQTSLNCIADWMRDYGQLVPILVREVCNGLEVLSGAEYLQAAGLVGLRSVTVSVCRATDTQAIELAAAFDRQPRSSRSALDRSRAVNYMLRPVDQGGAGMSAAAVAVRIGRSPGYVRRLARLVEFRGIVGERIKAGKYSEAKACELVPLLGRLGALAAADIDAFQRPDVWVTVADWRRNCRIILEIHASLRDELEPHPALVAASNREGERKMSKDVMDEIEERYWDRIVDELSERVPSKRPVRRPLDEQTAKLLISAVTTTSLDLEVLQMAIREQMGEEL